MSRVQSKIKMLVQIVCSSHIQRQRAITLEIKTVSDACSLEKSVLYKLSVNKTHWRTAHMHLKVRVFGVDKMLLWNTF